MVACFANLKTNATIVTLVKNENSGIDGASYTATLSDGTVLGFYGSILSYTNSDGVQDYYVGFRGAITTASSLVIPDSAIIDETSYVIAPYRIGDRIDNLTSISFPSSPVVVDSAFYSCRSVRSIKLPNATTVGKSAFAECYDLTSIDLPKATSIGLCAFESCHALTSINLPKATTIGTGAFRGCDAVTSIDLPNVTSVGDQAFLGCNALRSIDLPSATTIGDEAFSHCQTLASIDLPNATTIGDEAFSHSQALASIDLPNATTIGDEAFSFCQALASIDLPNATYIGKGAFFDCSALTSIDLPNATTIGDEAFYHCQALTSIYLPNATTIGGNAFYGCDALTSIDLPNATTIGYYTFDRCNSLTSISLPNAMTIGDWAFSDCSALTSIDLPNVTSIGSSAFVDCPALTSIALPNAMTIGDDAFLGCPLASIDLPNATTIGNLAFASCHALKRIDLPNATYIGVSAFNDCSALTSIDLPNATYIGVAAFANCSALTSIDLPNATSIGNEALAGCSSLVTFDIAASVDSIGQRAFAGCTALQTVMTQVVTPFVIADDVFDETAYESVVLKVPQGALQAYRDTPAWSRFTTIWEIGIEGQVATPTIARSGNSLIVTTATPGATIYYTLDGSMPDATSAVYIDGITVDSNCIVRVIAMLENYYPSEVVSYIIDWFCVDNVSFVQDGYVVTLSTPTAGATIHYNIGAGEQTYSAPLTLTENCTIEAYATREGYHNSDTTSYAFDAASVTVVRPVIAANGNKIGISTTTEDATIYYTLDGSTPTAESTAYSDSITVDRNCTVKAVAMRENWFTSEVATFEVDWIVTGFATFDGLVATVGGDKTLDDAFVEVGGRSEAAKTIAAVVWEKDAPLTDDMLEGLADNPNLLVYVSSEALALANVKNVVVDGVAKEIVLADTENGNNNFFVPQAFTAERISYSHNYTQQTTPGVSRGWETLVLPFAVQTVAHEHNGALLPYKTQPGDKTFWLRTLTVDGIKAAQRIVANMPYLISMPNNTDAYDAEYCQGGVVTFASENVTVPETQMTVAALADSSVVLHPTMQRVAQSASVYALNVGEPRGSYLEGSVFERDLRDVRPFECYTEHRGGTGGSRFITLGDMSGGNAMGIDDLQIFDLPICDLPIYNVAGQMVNRKSEAGTSVNSKLPKGVYIQRGRKVVIR